MECVVTAGKQWLPHWACSPTVAQLNPETEARYLTSTGSFYCSLCCSDERHELYPDASRRMGHRFNGAGGRTLLQPL
jgi:hypothetical protein